jgi:hypothetical protein
MRQGGGLMHSKKRRANHGSHPTIVCPVCGSPAKVYTSRPVTSSTRELFFRCSEPDCDASFRSLLSHANLIIGSRLHDSDPRRLPPDADMPKLRQRGPAVQDHRQLSLPELPGDG